MKMLLLIILNMRTRKDLRQHCSILTTGDEIRQPGQSQIGGCTCKIPLDMRVLRLFPENQERCTSVDI